MSWPKQINKSRVEIDINVSASVKNMLFRLKDCSLKTNNLYNIFLFLLLDVTTREVDESPNLIKCNRCMHTWLYRGKSKYFATCSYCRNLVRIDESNSGQEKQS